MNPIALLEKYFGIDTPAFEIVREHSRLVADKALRVARSLENQELNLQFIEEAAFLHDIGVCQTNAPGLGCFGEAPYIRHGIIGREILEAEGLFAHAMVCERHIGVGLTVDDIIRQGLPLPEREMVPLTLEEKIICFADLFYSKKPRNLTKEKTPEEVRNSLRGFGDHKVVILEQWLRDFTVTASA